MVPRLPLLAHLGSVSRSRPAPEISSTHGAAAGTAIRLAVRYAARAVPGFALVALWALASLLALAALLALTARPAPAAPPADELPFETTEKRERCDAYDPVRLPYFGTTHLHTGRSFDAAIRFVPPGPRDAYAFAKGDAPVKGVDPTGRPTREYYIDRSLDWGAVTDHAEHFGEVGICQSEDDPARFSLDCQLINGFYWQPGVGLPPSVQRSNASSAFTILVSGSLAPSNLNTRMPMCNSGEGDCDASELRVWREMQAAAEEAYDRTSACEFTSFVGYEMSAAPSGTNWHRTVIFRNADVVDRPISTLDLADTPNARPNLQAPTYNRTPLRIDLLWKKLEEQCEANPAKPDCQVITIPHNSNLGGGVGNLVPPMLFDPDNTENAEFQAKYERLVEIYQNKGSSECRWDPRFVPGGVGTVDEHCDFELLDSTSLTSASGVGAGNSASSAVPPSAFSERSFIRNVLKDGLDIQDDYEGVNPFRFGLVAASDSHNGTMGWHPENASFMGHEGIEDAVPVNSGSNIQNGSGGYAVVWAEENSRDSIFEALERKETYGTSGTRPTVRVFGGWNLDDAADGKDFCKLPAHDLAVHGYEWGVPMGGELLDARSADVLSNGDGASGGDTAPTLVVAAWKDDFIDTPLQQLQVVKGWREADGTTREKVYTVAGKNPPRYELDPKTGERVALPQVDPETCSALEKGEPRLCATWTDPDFDADQRAFYYVRVLEDPVCRWSTHWCREHLQIDPLSPTCTEDLEALRSSTEAKDVIRGQTAAFCCNDTASDVYVQPVIQERAWTSPIWYSPDATERGKLFAGTGGDPGARSRSRADGENRNAAGDTP